ncbi:MAG: hypothetical protein EXR92_02730 [Gemmatimonadetes bacterium]|nr:hypothetical protein [Gemmatimonadota bacterium]
MSFQLLFILAIIAASVFDAVAKARRQRTGPPPDADAKVEPGRRVPRRPTDGEREERIETRRAEGRPDASEQTGEGKTAASMIPPDLWAVLTGEAPPSSSEAPGSTDKGAKDRGYVDSDSMDHDSMDIEAEPWDDTGIGSDSADLEPADVAGIEGDSLEILPEGPEQEGTRSPTTVPWKPEPALVPVAPSVSDRERLSIAALAPGGQKARRLLPSSGRPSRPLGRVRYADAFSRGGSDELRRAIVLTEILGPPVALRGGGGLREDP